MQPEAMPGAWANRRMSHVALVTVMTVIVLGTLAVVSVIVWRAVRDPQRELRDLDVLAVDEVGAIRCLHPAGICAREHTTLDFDRREVTRGDWAACVSEGKCSIAVPDGDRDLPMTNVGWAEARSYCKWRGGDLPDEASWEIAARGPLARTYPWGEAAPDCERANHAGCGDRPRPARPSTATVDGIEDLAGNVAEWVRATPWNKIDPKTFERIVITEPDAREHPVRGGSFRDPPTAITAVARRMSAAGADDIGFRCAYEGRELPDQQRMRYLQILARRARVPERVLVEAKGVDLDDLRRGLAPYFDVRGTAPDAPVRLTVTCPKPREEEPEDSVDDDDEPPSGTAMTLDEGKMGRKEAERAERQYKLERDLREEQRRYRPLRGKCTVEIRARGQSLTYAHDYSHPERHRTHRHISSALAGLRLAIVVALDAERGTREILRVGATPDDFIGGGPDPELERLVLDAPGLSTKDRAQLLVATGKFGKAVELGDVGIAALEAAIDRKELRSPFTLRELHRVGGAARDLADRRLPDLVPTVSELRERRQTSDRATQDWVDALIMFGPSAPTRAILDRWREASLVRPEAHELALATLEQERNVPHGRGHKRLLLRINKPTLGGNLDSTAVQRQIHRSRLVMSCFEQHPSSDRAVLAFAIKTNGSVTAPLVEPSSSLSICLEAALGKLTFPAHSGDEPVRVQLVLEVRR